MIFQKTITLGGEIYYHSPDAEESKSVSAFSIGGLINTSGKFHILFSVGHNLINENLTITYLGLFVDHLIKIKNMNTQQKHTNSLINESSPYLLQHAHNSGQLVSMGQRSVGKSPQGEQTDHYQHRLCSLSLVPRNGTREFRGRTGGRFYE